MCGIIGYVGKKQSSSILLEGLRRLEYRGYDSAGIAIFDGTKLVSSKSLGQVKNLVDKDIAIQGTMGIGHTRWATHGGVTLLNTHPHFDSTEEIAVVHNGIIENYSSLRSALEAEGVVFTSETDTEVIPHLLRKHYAGDMFAALLATIPLLQGTYGIVIANTYNPNQLIAARLGSPLVIGVGTNENFVASDTSAIAQHTKNVVYLEDGDIAILTANSYEIHNSGTLVKRKGKKVSDEWIDTGPGEFAHYMLKEIHEQPQSLRRCFAGRIKLNRVKLGGINLTSKEVSKLEHVGIVSCGTSYHAGLVSTFAFEDLAYLRTTAHIASELRYRNPIVSNNDIYFGVSQSGETADTLHAMKHVKNRGAHIVGVVNVVGSTIARECGHGVYIHSGPEMSVASTKAFTSQVAALLLIAISFGSSRHLSDTECERITSALKNTPDIIENWLKGKQLDNVKAAAKIIAKAKQTIFIGRGVSAPVAMEGALKLKEISYIPSLAYPAGEMKHGPIALIDSETPVIAIVPRDSWRDKTISNIIEAKARGARVIVIHNEWDNQVKELGDVSIELPMTGHYLVSPLLTVVPLQLLAYETALLLDRNIDRPRNLAKSVTVE